MASNKQMNFNNGEGINYADFNDMRKMLQKEQGDFLYGPMVNPLNMRQAYSGSFGLGGANAIGTIGWCLGLVPGGANRALALHPGSFVLCTSDGSPPTDDGDYGDTGRANYQITFAGQSFELSANASGSDRWDLVVIDDTFSEVAGGAVNRDFKDATTGALSTESVNKRITISPGGATPFSIVEGTPGAGYPAWPTGYAPVARIKVRNGATELATSAANLIADIEDHTWPLGRRWIGMMGTDARRGADGTFGGDWNTSGNKLTVSEAANTAYYFPRDLTGRSDARLLGVFLAHESNEAFTAEIVRVNYDNAIDTVLSTLTVGMADLSHRNIMAFGDGTLPIWGNGTAAGRALEEGPGGVGIGAFGHVHSTVALKITSGAGTGTNATTICGVSFVFAVNEGR